MARKGLNRWLQAAAALSLVALAAWLGWRQYERHWLNAPLATLTAPVTFEVPQGASLAAVARDAIEQFAIMAESKSIELVRELDDQIMVTGDRIQLERLVSNLLTNAIKYTQEGGTVRVKVARQHRVALLAVEDSGCGIAPEHIPHIFDRLFRVPDGKADPERGLGLGLSFVAWIVKAHNGRIRVESKPGQGSRFEVTLPLRAVATAAVEERPAVPTVG